MDLREFEAKLERIRRWLAAERYDAVEITRYSWLAWLLEGAEARVLLSSERGNCSVIVTAEKIFMVANNIEAPRLKEEEIGELPLEWRIYNWWERPPSVLPQNARVASEMPASLRFSLLEPEVARARKLGREAAEGLETAARSLCPGLSEREIAGRIAAQAMGRGLTPAGLFVAADERGKQFRHPIPTAKIAYRYAILSLVARRHGLHASVTRTVSFGPACGEMLRRHRAASRVHAAMLVASLPGTPLGEIFAEAQRVYRDSGFAEEWTFHHQGGPAGYESREARAAPGSAERLQENQMVAWNPTIRGAKSEETALAAGRRVELLTRTGCWPELEGDMPLADVLMIES
ncbi:MAG TPA: M24 family metallopeptidase [Bryobacterales bacterium]|jgi:Xaa-Pro aminopeptidase|nr:M24 family metallopeptidase [Bryobacterales bacterium]